MGLALVPVILFAGTTSLIELVERQQGGVLGFLGPWHVVLLPSFLIFFISGVAETFSANPGWCAGSWTPPRMPCSTR